MTMARSKRRTPWQVHAIELILAAIAMGISYVLASAAGAGHVAAACLACLALGLSLRLITRHAGPKRKRSRSRKPAARRR
jgi:hypothetical protein